MKPEQSARGFTVLETLIVAAVIGILALAMIPMLSSQDPTRLDAAAAEAGNVLRFAISEANRTGKYIWVDGSVAGHLRVYSVATKSGGGIAAITDPLTKRDLDLDTSGPAFSGQVTMAPQFRYGGVAYTQLLIDPVTVPGTTLLLACSGGTCGVLEANSGIVLTLGARSVMVALNGITGRVALD